MFKLLASKIIKENQRTPGLITVTQLSSTVFELIIENTVPMENNDLPRPKSIYRASSLENFLDLPITTGNLGIGNDTRATIYQAQDQLHRRFENNQAKLNEICEWIALQLNIDPEDIDGNLLNFLDLVKTALLEQTPNNEEAS